MARTATFTDAIYQSAFEEGPLGRDDWGRRWLVSFKDEAATFEVNNWRGLL